MRFTIILAILISPLALVADHMDVKRVEDYGGLEMFAVGSAKMRNQFPHDPFAALAPPKSFENPVSFRKMTTGMKNLVFDELGKRWRRLPDDKLVSIDDVPIRTETVAQIIDENRFIRKGMDYVLEGYPTEGLAEGDRLQLARIQRAETPYSYTTVLGANRTIPVYIVVPCYPIEKSDFVKILQDAKVGFDVKMPYAAKCPKCHGRKTIIDRKNTESPQPCPTCHGTGMVAESVRIKVIW
ncbi:MAG: hypothetical protein RRC34_16325 [Lentisphaeria bacterium]|nr:hypothetical protein [Lentisphaeria bacterium]